MRRTGITLGAYIRTPGERKRRREATSGVRAVVGSGCWEPEAALNNPVTDLFELPPGVGVQVARAAENDIVCYRIAETAGSRKHIRGRLPSKARRPSRSHVHEIPPAVVVRSVGAECHKAGARPSRWIRREIVRQAYQTAGIGAASRGLKQREAYIPPDV